MATLKQADEAADKVADLFRPKLDVLIASALGLVEAGEKEVAMAKLKEAAEEALNVNEKNIPNITEKGQFLAMRLREVRDAMNKIGDREGTSALLKQELELVKEIKNAQRKASSLRAIATSLVPAGEFQQAMEIIQLIDDNNKRKDQMRIMAESLAKTDRRGHFQMTVDITCLKKTFTPEEQAFAKQLVEAMQEE